MAIQVPEGARFEDIGRTNKPAYNKIVLDKNEVIANLHLFSHYCDSRQLSSKQYDAWENAIASSGLVTRLFGDTWWDACRAAGLFGERIPKKELTRALLAQFMIDATADSDSNPEKRVPSARILKAYQNTSGWPISAKAYDRVVDGGMNGCWKALVEAWGESRQAQPAPSELVLSLGDTEVTVEVPAGFSVSEIESSRGANVHPDAMLDSLRACAEDLKKNSFTFNEYASWKSPRKRGSAGAIGNKFGRWRYAMERAGLVASTIFMEDVEAKSLVEHLMAAAFDPDANPAGLTPGRKQLAIYGKKIGISYTHYHYEQVYGSISKCWSYIKSWQAGEISEEVLLSAAKPREAEPGLVYLIQNGDTEEFTIGKTRRSMSERLKEYKTHNPNPKVIARKKFRDMGKKETELHARFAEVRMGPTEWFKLDGEAVEEIVRELS